MSDERLEDDARGVMDHMSALEASGGANVSAVEAQVIRETVEDLLRALTEPAGERVTMNCIGCGEDFDHRDDAQSVYHEHACQVVAESYPELATEIARRLRAEPAGEAVACEAVREAIAHHEEPEGEPSLRCRCGERFTQDEFNRWQAHDCAYRRYENEHGEEAPEGWTPPTSDAGMDSNPPNGLPHLSDTALVRRLEGHAEYHYPLHHRTARALREAARRLAAQDAPERVEGSEG